MFIHDSRGVQRLGFTDTGASNRNENRDESKLDYVRAYRA